MGTVSEFNHLPPKSLKHLAAAAILVVSLFSPGSAFYEHIVKAPGDLAALAVELSKTLNVGEHVVEFQSYSNVGQFKLAGPVPNLQVLTFTRSSEDSANVINVDSTLFDLKSLSGTQVVLRGLAFKLANAKALLIAGAETGRGNGTLVIDSCFIYADSLDGSFLTWLTDTSNVEIRRSFIVTRNAKPATRIHLSARNILLANTLFNFPGALQATVNGKVEIVSNVFNRTQMKLLGDLIGLAQPNITFTQNLVAFKPALDAFVPGTQDIWFLNHQGFNTLTFNVRINRQFNDGWKGFDFQPALPDAMWSASPTTNIRIDPITGKSDTTSWDWYLSPDSLMGLQTGDYKRKQPYNVLPGRTSFAWTLPKGLFAVHFQSGPFPRHIQLDSISDRRLDTAFTKTPTLRQVLPSGNLGVNALHFGAFQVDSIVYQVKALHGVPLLVVHDSEGKPLLQNPTGASNSTQTVFPNAVPAARRFILTNVGNTPRGVDVTMERTTSGMATEDTVSFAKVDSAGQSNFLAPGLGSPAANVRDLDRVVAFRSTASISGDVTFGTTLKIAPYRFESLRWYVPATNTYETAANGAGPNVNRYLATIPYAPAAKPDFRAHLVELLSVPRGASDLSISGGSIHSYSVNGYQWTIDSLLPPDEVRYGKSTKGYRFKWIARGNGDTLKLNLKAFPDLEPWVAVGGKIDTIHEKPDTAGFYRINIAHTDSGKIFFLAMKYNVLAGQPVGEQLEGAPGAKVFNLTSNTSGRLSFKAVEPGFLEAHAEPKDAPIQNTVLLGGRYIGNVTVTPKDPYGLSFQVEAYRDRTKLEVWAWSNQTWTRIPAWSDSTFGNKPIIKMEGLPTGTQTVIVVERLQDPEKYLTLKPEVVAGQLIVTPSYADTLLKPVTGYCVQLRSISSVFEFDTTLCRPKMVTSATVTTDTTLMVLDPALAYQYRFRYYMGNDSITKAFQPLNGATWDAKSLLPANLVSREKKRWHFLGFPFEATLGDVMKQDNEVLPETVLVQNLVMRPKQGGGWDTVTSKIRYDSVKVKAGSALLFASSYGFSYSAATVGPVPPPARFNLPVNDGWNFIANPFPVTLIKARISTKLGRSTRFYQLSYNQASAGIKYGWDSTSDLKAFTGYAYHSSAPDTLIFDPVSELPTTSAPPRRAAKSAASITGPSALRAWVENASGGSSMLLSADKDETGVPFLAAPGNPLELRLGGRSGYLIKPVASLSAVDEALEIRSAASGRAAFRLAPQAQVTGASASAPIRMRLIDLVSGRIYDESSAGEITLAAGANPFRLFAGDAAFIEAQTQSFLSGAPEDIGLSQNYPNPFLGKTRIVLDWPAWQNGERKAVLDVMDMQGRSVHSQRLRDIRFGRQILTLDASGWRPGLYLYRLTVTTAGRESRLQKRMLVSP
jgi:hypothetical protein